MLILCCYVIIKSTFNFLYFNFSKMKATQTTPCPLLNGDAWCRGAGSEGPAEVTISPPIEAFRLKPGARCSGHCLLLPKRPLMPPNEFQELLIFSGHFPYQTDGKPNINNTVLLTMIFLCFPMCTLISFKTIVCSNANCSLGTSHVE